MTKGAMTNTEKEKLEAMKIFFDVDICTAFECPEEGCDECPIRTVIDAQENLMRAIVKTICNH